MSQEIDDSLDVRIYKPFGQAVLDASAHAPKRNARKRERPSRAKASNKREGPFCIGALIRTVKEEGRWHEVHHAREKHAFAPLADVFTELDGDITIGPADLENPNNCQCVGLVLMRSY